MRHAIVSRRFAGTFWPGESAIGKRVRRGDRDSDNPWNTIVGVTEDVLEAGESTIWDKRLQWYLPTSLGTDYDRGHLPARLEAALRMSEVRCERSDARTVARYAVHDTFRCRHGG